MSDARLIKTEAEYDEALAEVDKLFEDLPEPGTERGNRLELLSVLISHYEDRHYPIRKVDPIELLHFAITDMGRSQAELAGLLGSRSRASEVMSRKRALTLEMIRAISEAWKLPVAALVLPYEVFKPVRPAQRREAVA